MAEADREEALIKAQQSDHVKSLFLANVSHEIRTPLNSILGFSELIWDRLKQYVGSEEKQFFDIISRSGTRLMRTIHGILDISQIEAGTYKIDVEEVNVSQIIGNCLQDMLPEASAKGLQLEFIPHPEQFTIESNEYCISQTLINIIDNSIKYSEKGAITITMQKLPDSVEVLIKDKGIGISADYMKQIFATFSQESTGFTKDYQGVGLGLSLTKKYLDMIDAKINLQSQKNQGTTVKLNFPYGILSNKLQEIKKPKPQGAVNLERLTDRRAEILLVEDDINSQKLVDFLLHEEFKIRIADSFDTAIAEIEIYDIECIILDLSLRDQTDGLDLVSFLRQSKQYKHIPVIALTAHAFTTKRTEALEAGCNDFLTKPFNKDELINSIRANL